MKTVVKMYRRLDSGELRPIEAFMSPTAIADLHEDEPTHPAVILRIFHGNCLEAEASVSFVDKGRVSVTLTEKKEMAADAPSEATCSS